MPQTNTIIAELRNRVAELEAENRQLREAASWTIMQVRQCAEAALRAMCDLEGRLLLSSPTGDVAA